MHAHAPPPRTELCALEEIPEGGGCERSFGPGNDRFRILLLRRGAEVWGYVNLCPHFSLPLDYEPGVFRTYDGEILMCAHHSAMFRFEDGECFDGPCKGQRLTPAPVRVRGGRVCWRG
jgi:nitrite reductase/ring-hydroxylating ferredoxin subunit